MLYVGKAHNGHGQSFGKDLGAARSRLGSAHDVMPRVVVVVIVIVVVVVVASSHFIRGKDTHSQDEA